MSDELPDFAPTHDGEARTMVRTLTGYDDTNEELSSEALDSHLRIAKLQLYNDVGAESFYDDAGLGQALVAAAAIYAKASIENYSVDRWSIGDTEVDVGAFNNPEGAQFVRWAELHANGLQSSDVTPDYAPSNTSGYIGGRR